jgi:hypothetical protein
MGNRRTRRAACQRARVRGLTARDYLSAYDGDRFVESIR